MSPGDGAFGPHPEIFFYCESVQMFRLARNRRGSRSFISLSLIFVACITFSGSGSCSAASGYSIVDLGDLGGGYARARAINNQGQVVVGESLIPGTGVTEHATVWQDGAALDLGTLGGQRSRALDLNNAGSICGWAENAAGQALPAVWSQGTVTALSTPGGLSGSAWGINDAGVAVGDSYVSGGAYHAALWDATGYHDLGTLGGTYSFAYDVNNLGVVAGYAYDASGHQEPCEWGTSGPISLGSVLGGQWNTAREINDSGQVILWGTPTGATSNHAVFWDGNPLDHAIDLGTFGGSESWAYGLNNRGNVVGWAELSDSTYHAFVWNGTAMTDLGTLGGYFSAAFGVNDEGDIVGFALDTYGDTHAVEWVPVPEPTSTGAVIAAGLVVFALCRQRCR